MQQNSSSSARIFNMGFLKDSIGQRIRQKAHADRSVQIRTTRAIHIYTKCHGCWYAVCRFSVRLKRSRYPTCHGCQQFIARMLFSLIMYLMNPRLRGMLELVHRELIIQLWRLLFPSSFPSHIFLVKLIGKKFCSQNSCNTHMKKWAMQWPRFCLSEGDCS